MTPSAPAAPPMTTTVTSSPGVSWASFDEERERFIDLLATRPFDLAYEPIVHIQSGRQVGAEVLARFRHSAPTAEMLRVAHALGVGVGLELRILEQALGQIDASTPGFVGINMSPAAVIDPRGDRLLSLKTAADVVIEITDQTALPDTVPLRRRIAEVREMGCSIAIHISELGTETMRQLILCEPDVAKFDVALTQAIVSGYVSTTAMGNLFRYCRHHGVFTVAVGVETDAHLSTLHDLGVDATQGYLHSGLIDDSGPVLLSYR